MILVYKNCPDLHHREDSQQILLWVFPLHVLLEMEPVQKVEQPEIPKICNYDRESTAMLDLP